MIDLGKLSPRQTQVLHMVALGWRDKTIASTLGITEATVKVTLKHTRLILGLRSETRVELVLRYLTAIGRLEKSWLETASPQPATRRAE